MKIIKQPLIYKWILFSIITTLLFGVTLYFSFIFIKNEKTKIVDNYLPSKEFDKILNLTNENSNYQTFSEKNSPSFRNGYKFDCSFTYDEKSFIVKQNNNNYEKDIICLFMKNKKTNNFPIIVFSDLLDELNPLPIEAYEYVNDQIIIKPSFITSIENSKRENEARNSAKIISELLLNSFSFDSRLVFLDSIIFKIKNDYEYLLPYELGEYTTSNNDYITHSSYLDPAIKANERTISLYVRPYVKKIIVDNNSLKFETSRNNGFNKKIMSLHDVAFDVLETLYVFVKQYGKLLFQILKPSSENILNILDPIFNAYEEKRQFLIFYNYFNSLNKNKNLNYIARSTNKDLDLTVYDRTILNNFRKLFSYSISRLTDEFSNYSLDSIWQLNTFNRLKYGLLHYPIPNINELVLEKRKNYPLPELLEEYANNSITNSNSNELINKKEYDKFYSHIINNGYFVYTYDLESSFSFSNIATRINSDKLYYLISNNYPPSSSLSLLIGDIFPLQKQKNINIKYEDSSSLKSMGTGCLAQPVNFTTLSGDHFESIILKRVVKDKLGPKKVSFSNISYSELSNSIDKETLKTLSNFFSIKEIFSSIFAIYSFNYFDKRNTINGCTFNYSYQNNNKTPTYFISPVEENKMYQFSDYMLFSMFKMQLFGSKIERNIYNNLFGYNIDEGRLYSYNTLLYDFKQKEYEIDDLKKRNFAYSINKVTYSNEELINWSTLYLPLLIQVEDYENAFLLQIESHVNNTPIIMNAISYDYNNLFINISNLNKSSIDDKNIFKEFIYDDYKNKKKYIGIVVKLGFVYGQYKPIFDLKGIKSINQAENIFNNIKYIYIDKNRNMKFDPSFDDIFLFINEA